MALAASFCFLIFNHYLYTVVVYRHINECALVRININLCLVLKAFFGQRSGNRLSFNESNIYSIVTNYCSMHDDPLARISSDYFESSLLPQ